ncbi:sugar-transfer associated ATP-grasp domain-containing protein [Thalassovita sp.]|uniref:sugar-transfer associated ATP-grasp domain-containing protein n=1 Tax=Thalassovita sp. TaxID=1979401 RepID=UPI0029DE86CE|nr:sugar-transfer associated ATP-grasp domain-containing protein [Thalassovita sp.]
MARLRKFPLSLLPVFWHGHRPWKVAHYCEPGRKDLSRFLGSLQRRRLMDSANRASSSLIKNKLCFPALLGRHAHLVPENIGFLKDGRCYDLRQGGFDPVDPLALLADFGGDVVVKPVDGMQSLGVHFVSLRDGVPLLDGTPLGSQQLIALADPQGSIICRRVEQHPDLARIFPDALMTVRVLSFFDDLTGRGHVLNSFVRIGTRQSAPFEAAARGGRVANFDFATGRLEGMLELGKLGYFGQTPRRYLDNHPDTGQRVAGVTLPNWPTVRDAVQGLIDELPLFEFIGWDIVITTDGFAILEANTRPFLEYQQYFTPLLDHPQFRAFLVRRGIVPG